jgi:hypothetical protein
MQLDTLSAAASRANGWMHLCRVIMARKKTNFTLSIKVPATATGNAAQTCKFTGALKPNDVLVSKALQEIELHRYVAGPLQQAYTAIQSRDSRSNKMCKITSETRAIDASSPIAALKSIVYANR